MRYRGLIVVLAFPSSSASVRVRSPLRGIIPDIRRQLDKIFIACRGESGVIRATANSRPIASA